MKGVGLLVVGLWRAAVPRLLRPLQLLISPRRGRGTASSESTNSRDFGLLREVCVLAASLAASEPAFPTPTKASTEATEATAHAQRAGACLAIQFLSHP